MNRPGALQGSHRTFFLRRPGRALREETTIRGESPEILRDFPGLLCLPNVDTRRVIHIWFALDVLDLRHFFPICRCCLSQSNTNSSTYNIREYSYRDLSLLGGPEVNGAQGGEIYSQSQKCLGLRKSECWHCVYFFLLSKIKGGFIFPFVRP